MMRPADGTTKRISQVKGVGKCGVPDLEPPSQE